MSDKMRDDFELWAISCHMCTYLDGVEYRHQSTEWAWMAWQASRAALVVELPAQLEYPSADYDYASEAFNETIEGVKSALDDAGVSYK